MIPLNTKILFTFFSFASDSSTVFQNWKRNSRLILENTFKVSNDFIGEIMIFGANQSFPEDNFENISAYFHDPRVRLFCRILFRWHWVIFFLLFPPILSPHFLYSNKIQRILKFILPLIQWRQFVPSYGLVTILLGNVFLV